MDWIESCVHFSAAAGIPVSLFENGESISDMKSTDPGFMLSIFKPLPVTNGIVYTVISDYLFYGTVSIDNRKIVIGPVASYKCTQKLAQNLLTHIGTSTTRTNELLQYFSEKPYCSIRRFLDALRYIGRLSGFGINEDLIYLPFEEVKHQSNLVSDSQWEISENDQEFENKIIFYVETGNVAALTELFDSLKQSQPGLLDTDALRSIKNTFIMSTSVITRSAIRGGLDFNTAMAVQGSYLFSVEEMQSFQEVFANLYKMFMDFTSRVADSKIYPEASPVVIRACRYINANINNKLNTSEIASALGYNRSYLCRVFKAQTGLTITHYILQNKINTAKKLIVYTSKSLAEISVEIGFSSQNYFQSTFKKYTGETPGAYRVKESGI